MASIKLGDLAPAFTLYNQDVNEVSIEDFTGTQTVVLYF